MIEVSIAAVFLAALLTALATGLGAAPFLVTSAIGPRHVGIANAIAAGLMLAASHSLIAEGMALGPGRTLLGVLLGLAAIVAGQTLIEHGPEHDIGALSGADARKAILIVGVMTAHSFAEGVGVGVAFGGSGELAAFITAAIAIHNIPEGLAIALVLVPRGTPVWQAAMWGIFTSLPQPLAAEYNARLVHQPFAVHVAPAGGITVVPIAELDISATMIREATHHGRSTRYLLPDNIYQYIQEHKLYTGD